MHPVEPIGGGHGSVTNPRREQPATLWTWWTTQARCPHAHSDNNKRRQPFEIGQKSPTRLHEEAFLFSCGSAPLADMLRPSSLSAASHSSATLASVSAARRGAS